MKVPDLDRDRDPDLWEFSAARWTLGAWVTPASLRGANRPMRIVGVVADARSAGAEHAAVPTVYVPFAQVDADIYAYIRTFKSNAPPLQNIATLNEIVKAASKPYKP